MTVASTILTKFHSNFVSKSCNICRIWCCDLRCLSNSIWCGSPQTNQNSGQHPH